VCVYIYIIYYTYIYRVATPYVIMAIGNSFHKTTPAQSAADPTWGETFEFAVQPALMQVSFGYILGLFRLHTRSLSAKYFHWHT
jgi:hypothetical protein